MTAPKDDQSRTKSPNSRHLILFPKACAFRVSEELAVESIEDKMIKSSYASFN